MKCALISEDQIKRLRQYLINQPINSGCIEMCELLMSLNLQELSIWKMKDVNLFRLGDDPKNEDGGSSFYALEQPE